MPAVSRINWLAHAQDGPYLSGTSPCAQCLAIAPRVYHLSIATKEIKVNRFSCCRVVWCGLSLHCGKFRVLSGGSMSYD